MNTKPTMVYLAAPYSHPNRSIIEIRMHIVYQIAAKLLSMDIHNISPLTQGHVLSNHETPNDWLFWQEYSYNLLSRCDYMAFISMPGWDTSVGLNAEIKYALEKGIVVKRISPIDGNYIPFKIEDYIPESTVGQTT